MTRRWVVMLGAGVLSAVLAGCGERERLEAQIAKAEVEREQLRADLRKADEGSRALVLRLADIDAQDKSLRAQTDELKAELQQLKAQLAAALQEQEKWRKAADEAKVAIAQKDGEIKERDAALKEVRDFLARSDQNKEALRKELQQEKNAWWLDKFFKDLFPPPPPPPEK